jgi:protein O-GlcNAc transferase
MELTIDRALEKAIEAYESGNLIEAELIYRAILNDQPKHPDANHNLGVLALAVGKPQEAVTYLKVAAETSHNSLKFWLSYIDGLIAADDLNVALEILVEAKAIGLHNDDFEKLSKKLNEKAVSKNNSTSSNNRQISDDSDHTSPSQTQLDEIFSLWALGNFAAVEKLANDLARQFPKHPLPWKALGAVAIQQGRPCQALAPMEQAVRLSPDDAESHSNLGNVLKDLGRLADAEASYLKAIQLNPNFAETYSNLGMVLKDLNRLTDAERHVRKSIRLKYDLPQAHSNLGVILENIGRLEEAEASYREAVRLKPDFSRAYGNLASLLKSLGRFSDAESYYREAIRFNPYSAEAYCNLGMLFYDLNRLLDAEASYREAIRLQPNIAMAHSNLSLVLRNLGRFNEAEASCREAIRISPDLSEAYVNLSILLRDLGRFIEAETICRELIRCKPNIAEAHGVLATVLRDLRRLDDAELCCLEAIRLKPKLSETHSNLGTILKDLGRMADAEASYTEAIRLNPAEPKAYSSLLLTTLYTEKCQDDLWKLHKEFGNQFEKEHKSSWPRHENLCDQDRKLRIGYVSGDFRKHAVSFFIKPIFELHDKKNFEVYAYSNHFLVDSITSELRMAVDHWRQCAHLNDKQLFHLIRQDQIDILIDLSGHTAFNRLTLFALKPAPIQITWLGYPGTTGLSSIDYRITYESLDPDGFSEEFHSEKLIRLPDSVIQFEPLGVTPDVNELPALNNQAFTFACLNNHAKISDYLIEIWIRIMKRVPQARFVLGNARNTQPQQVFQKKLADAGIGSDRLILKQEMSLEAYWNLYREIDLQLDTFPYNGGTTSLQSLWMGVPVITLAGNMTQSRVGVAVLKRAGLSSFIADTKDEYIAKAEYWTKNLFELNVIRKSLREKLSGSSTSTQPLIDHLEAAYRDIWTDYCRKNRNGS